MLTLPPAGRCPDPCHTCHTEASAATREPLHFPSHKHLGSQALGKCQIVPRIVGYLWGQVWACNQLLFPRQLEEQQEEAGGKAEASNDLCEAPTFPPFITRKGAEEDMLCTPLTTEFAILSPFTVPRPC